MNLKTSDMAICAETSAFTIREYSNLGLLGPVPRDESNNYRSFDPRQIPLVYLLKTLRELGFSSREFARFGESRSPRETRDLLLRYSGRLDIELRHMQANLDILNSYLSLLEEGLDTRPGEIVRRALPERPVRLSSLVSFSSRAGGKERLRRAAGQIRQNGNAGCPIGFMYNDFGSFAEQPGSPAQLVSFDPRGPDIRPAGDYLVAAEACFYGEAGSLPQRLLAYAGEKQLALGAVCTVYLHDAACATEPEQYLLQATAEIK